ncbi:hypothetical protein M404DRAFT_368631 [Pisolithus tinctorius Marx 270]|uniref:Uncharacterized protein n=1 Tax=Pisolithus tinctorius Marx 270 TaxID=870435 RepID=A0A0C3JB47_PISTI|nr:hypothetical protein M404DRAFT_368631 [Pisolithus tinctorius Marx 270]
MGGSANSILSLQGAYVEPLIFSSKSDKGPRWKHQRDTCHFFLIRGGSQLGSIVRSAKHAHKGKKN